MCVEMEVIPLWCCPVLLGSKDSSGALSDLHWGTFFEDDEAVTAVLSSLSFPLA